MYKMNSLHEADNALILLLELYSELDDEKLGKLSPSIHQQLQDISNYVRQAIDEDYQKQNCTLDRRNIIKLVHTDMWQS